MSTFNLGNIDHMSHVNILNIGEENVHENLTKVVDQSLTNIKKCLDKVLDLRGKYSLIPLTLKLIQRVT
jgi:hypothetical protein